MNDTSKLILQYKIDEHLRQFINASPCGILVVSAAGQIELVNTEAERLFGYPNEELLDQPIENLIPERFRKKHPHDRQVFFNRPEARQMGSGRDLAGLRADGTEFPVEIGLSPIEIAGQSFLLATVVDITQRKLSELALRESEMTLSVIFEQAAVGVAQIESRSGKFLRINKKYSDIIGYSYEEMLSLDFMKITHPDDLQEDLDNMQLLLDGKIHEFSMEKRLFRKGDSIVWVNLTVSPMWRIGEQPNNHVAVVKDITKRKHAEEETLQLLQQNRELTQRMFKIQEDERRYIARELHDEFGQQLAVIHLNAETIKILSKKQHLKIHESAQIIDEITIDVQKNIRGMLRQLRPTLLDETGLMDSLKELVNQWQIRFPTIDIKISIEGELNDFEENLNISIYRVIQESLTNVAKHAMAHNVSVQLIRQPGGIEAHQDCLLLIVEDNGKGLNGTIAEGAELPGLRERVIAVGGKFAVKSIKGKGVHIEARIPINVTL